MCSQAQALSLSQDCINPSSLVVLINGRPTGEWLPWASMIRFDILTLQATTSVLFQYLVPEIGKQAVDVLHEGATLRVNRHCQ